MISVIIPTFNRRDSLGRCLESLARMDCPADSFEVVVVDDGSAYPMGDLVDSFAGRMPLRVFRQENSGPASARNYGARMARGAWLAFLDDDCEASPGWLRALADAASRTDEMLGGMTVNALPDNLYSAASQMLVDYVSSYFFGEQSRLRFITSNNFAVDAEAFRESGGFDARFSLAAAEDRDFCYRWLGSGGQVRMVPEAQVRHAHRLTLRKFWMQQFNYGRGAFRFHAARRKERGSGIRVERLGFYTGMMLFPLRDGVSRSRVFIAALMGLSQVANLAGFLRER